MTFRHDHLECDNCHAVKPVVAARDWEATSASTGPAAHLCPKCSRLSERGELASNPLDTRCARCGRTPDDGIHDWRIAFAASGDRFVVCVECFDEDEDADVV